MGCRVSWFRVVACHEAVMVTNSVLLSFTFSWFSGVFNYSLVLKWRHVSLVLQMNIIRPNTLLIKGAMTVFWIKPFYKCIVMPLFRDEMILCTENNQSV